MPLLPTPAAPLLRMQPSSLGPATVRPPATSRVCAETPSGTLVSVTVPQREGRGLSRQAGQTTRGDAGRPGGSSSLNTHDLINGCECTAAVLLISQGDCLYECATETPVKITMTSDPKQRTYSFVRSVTVTGQRQTWEEATRGNLFWITRA